jgi:hypothetical protein
MPLALTTDLSLSAGLLQLLISLGMNLPSPEKRDYRNMGSELKFNHNITVCVGVHSPVKFN